MKTISEIVLYKVYDINSALLNYKIVACSAELDMDLTFMLYLLSYIFKYGEELQQSDETL